MRTRVMELKVKIKSLAAEARIIRSAEDKARSKGNVKTKIGLTLTSEVALTLKKHRTKVVRAEQRSSLIAYAFIRGKAFYPVERRTKFKREAPKDPHPPDWKRVLTLINSFGSITKLKSPCTMETLEAWCTGTIRFDPISLTVVASDANPVGS